MASDAVPRLVIDSSVAVKWFLAERERHVPEALDLLHAHQSGEVVLCAPAHILLEVPNALRSRGLDASGLALASRALLGTRMELAPLEDLAEDAAILASERGLSVYDAAFALLAQRFDCELVTADRRLAESGACRARLL